MALVTNAELERAIDADPDDEAKLLVYADWLQQQGDPRGELAALQRAGLDAEADALLAKHVDHLLGPLDPLFRIPNSGLDPRWRCGFLDSIRITAVYSMDDAIAAIDDRYERWPIMHEVLPDEDDSFGIYELLRVALENPSSRFLRDLRFGLTTNDYGPLYDRAYGNTPTLLDALATYELPALRRLEFGALDFAHGETEYSWVGLGDIGKVLRRHRHLHEVVLTGAGEHFDAHRFTGASIPNPMRLHLGEIDMPELRAFAVHVTDLRRSQLESILHASWPKLERLDVWFGDTDRGGECRLSDAVRLLASLETTPGNLAYLGLGNAEFTDELIEPLANSAVLRRLKTLDLSRGCLSNEGAALIGRHANAFAHLDRLILDESYLTAEGEQTVAGVCREVSVADQRDVEPGRYVAVGE